MAASEQKKTSEQKKAGKKKGKKKVVRVPYYYCPEKMTMEEWQIALRRQMARDEKYTISSVDEDKFPGEYIVENPKSRLNINSYIVVQEVRGTIVRAWISRPPNWEHASTSRH